MSRTCDCDVAVAMRDCGISTTSQTHVPFVSIAFLRSWSIKHRQWKHKLDYNGAVFAHLATRCGINAKDPSRLDSDRWIPHSRCCENPAWAKALPGFSRHLSAGFHDLNPAPRGLSLYDFSNPWLSEWVIKFNGLSRTADSEVHIVHISRVIIACTLKSLSPPT